MSYTKLIKSATEGVGFTSFKEGDGRPRRGPIPKVSVSPILEVANYLAKNTRGVTPQKPTVAKGKGKIVEKGKDKLVEPPKQKSFQLRTGGALRIEKEPTPARPVAPTTIPAQPTAPHLHTSGPLKMEGRAKRPLATPPQVARALKLVDKPKESEEPPLKKKKKKKITPEATMPSKIMQDQLASFLGARKRTSPKPVVKTIEEVKAFIANELIATKPLNMAPLDSIGATPKTTIPIESTSFQPLGSNIQQILDDIELDVELDNSIGMEHERAKGSGL